MMFDDDALVLVLHYYVSDYVKLPLKLKSVSLSAFPLVCKDFHRVCCDPSNDLASLCIKYVPDFYVNTSRARVFQKRTLDRLTEEYDNGSTTYYKLSEEQEMCSMLLFQLFKYPVKKYIYVVRVPECAPKSKNNRRTVLGYEALLNAPLMSYFSFEQECIMVKFPRFTVPSKDVFVLEVYSDKGNNLEAKTIALMELGNQKNAGSIQMMKWSVWDQKMKSQKKRKSETKCAERKLRKMLFGF